MSTTYYDAMKSYGFSYNTTASVRKMTCPKCGFQFSLVYARTFACQGCLEAAKGCPKVRCAKCDTEFFLKQAADVYNDNQQRSLADHITSIINTRNDDLGIVSTKR